MWFIFIFLFSPIWANLSSENLFTNSVLSDKQKAEEMEKQVVKIFYEKMKTEERDPSTKNYGMWMKYIGQVSH